MIPGAQINKRVPISPIHARYKLGYPAAFLSCDCGATLDLNKAPHKHAAGEGVFGERTRNVCLLHKQK